MWPLETPSFDGDKLLCECEVSWNRIVRGIEILVLKGFGIVYMNSMVGEWCVILIIHRQ